MTTKGYYEVLEFHGRDVETIAFADTKQELAGKVNLGALPEHQQVMFHAPNTAKLPTLPTKKPSALFEVCASTGREVETIATATSLVQLATQVNLSRLPEGQKVFRHVPGKSSKQVPSRRLSSAARYALHRKARVHAM
jgi:hypothetical protein